MKTKTKLQEKMEKVTVVYSQFIEGSFKYDRFQKACTPQYCTDQNDIDQAFLRDVETTYNGQSPAGDRFEYLTESMFHADFPKPNYFDGAGIYEVSNGFKIWESGDYSADYDKFVTKQTDLWDFYKNIASFSQKIAIIENLEMVEEIYL